jgi:uncharacterized protein YozE (UPF0346 family)
VQVVSSEESDREIVNGSFSSWLRKQTGRDDPVGKFATVVLTDPQWPLVDADLSQNEEYLALRAYVRMGMEDLYTVDKIVIFEEAWAEFEGHPELGPGQVAVTVAPKIMISKALMTEHSL